MKAHVTLVQDREGQAWTPPPSFMSCAPRPIVQLARPRHPRCNGCPPIIPWVTPRPIGQLAGLASLTCVPDPVSQHLHQTKAAGMAPGAMGSLTCHP